MFEVERRREKALFAAIDAIAIVGGILSAAFVNLLRGTPPCVLCPAERLHLTLVTLALVSLWIASGRALGLYDLRPGNWKHFFCIIKTSIVTFAIALVVSFLLHGEPPRILAGLILAFSTSLVLGARQFVGWLLRRFRGHPNYASPIAILGFNSFGRYLADQIGHSFKQYDVIGFLDLANTTGSHAGRRVLGGLEEIPRLARQYGNLEIAIVLPDTSAEMTERIITTCERNRVRWRLMPAVVRSLPSGLQVDNVGVIPLIGPRGSNIQGLNFVLKRSCDLAVTALALAIAAPAMLAATLAILIFDGRPVLFRQTRIGLYGKPFQLLKFRTMKAAGSDATHQAFVRQWIQNGSPVGDQNGNGKIYKMTQDPRVTAVGRILRRFSIDELPQLINVMRGEMSLIGPRPALSYELELYQDWHRSRLATLPGITGLWQVSGRNSLSFEEMVRLDIRYMENWSLAQDLRIMVRTIPALLNGGGH